MRRLSGISLLAPLVMIGLLERSLSASDFEEVHFVFTGVMVLDTSQAAVGTYTFKLPRIMSQEHPHRAYIQAGLESITAHPGFAKPVRCERTCAYEYVSLDGQLLTIDESDMAPNQPLVQLADLGLAPLGRLARRSDKNATFDTSCRTAANPAAFAACISLTKGSLYPIPDDLPVEWRFKTEHSLKDSDIQQCVPDAVGLQIRLVKDTKSIKLTASSPGAASVTINLDESGVTLIVIGNSLHQDVCCATPPDRIEKKDLHFRHLYAHVKAATKIHEYIPHRTNISCQPMKEVPKNVAADRLLNTTIRGSNCLGGQWP